MQARYCWSRSISSFFNGRLSGDDGETRYFRFVLLVAQRLLLVHGDEIGVDRATRQLPLHFLLASAQHDGLQLLMQKIEIPVADGASFLVQLVEIPVEAEQGTEDTGVEELHDRIDLVDAVLHRCAGEYEGVGAVQPLDRDGGFGLPVLDALGLVQNDDIRGENVIDFIDVGPDLLVIGEKKERRLVVLAQALGARSLDDMSGQVGELGDLLLPFALERGGGDHQHSPDAPGAA